MKITMTKTLKIALNGNDVQTYREGDVIDNPHPDVLALPQFWEPVDEALFLAQEKARNVYETRTALSEAQALVKSLKLRLKSLSGDKRNETVEPIDVDEESEEPANSSSGTKDD